jgi:type II secretory pathway pseudopilin PulG
MAFLSLMLLMVATALSFAAFYVMLEPSIRTRSYDQTQKTADTLKAALIQFQGHYGTPLPTPSTLDYLREDLDNDGCVMDEISTSPTYGQLYGWCGPYVDSVWQSVPNAFMLDGWGTAFEFGTTSGNELRSCGPDKVCGGVGGSDDLIFSF